jgi:hypothetical protein
MIHNLIATNLNLFTWNIKDSPLCILCNEVEDYDHFFTSCSYLRQFWSKVNTTFKKCGISKNMNKLENIIVGYKIETPEYNIVNVILSFIVYVVYQTYMLSDRRTNHINMWSILRDKLRTMLYFFEYNNFEISFLKSFVFKM